MKFSKDGYKKNSKDKDNPVNYIKGGSITMRGVSHPVMAIPYDKDGNPMPAKLMQPEEEYNFGGEVSYVMEIPYKKGGEYYAQAGGYQPQFLVQNTPAFQWMQQQTQNPVVPVNPNPQQLNQDVENFDQDQALQEAQANLNFANSLPQYQGMTKEQMQGAVDMEIPSEQTNNDQFMFNPFQTQNKTQFFNPYGGYDIPTASYLLGENIEQGDTWGTVSAAAKIALGVGRNLASGMGNARRNQFITNEADQNMRDSLTQTRYAQEGGELSQDDIAVLQKDMSNDIQFSEDWLRQNVEKVQPVQPEGKPVVNLGRYKGVNYFDIEQTPNGVILKTTQANPHNADTVKELLPYLKEMNPNTNLDIQYVPKYKEGGETEKLTTGEYVTGMKGAESESNIEVEEGEWMLFNNGDVSKVLGDKHKDGGEKMNVEPGTKIISAYTKIGKDTAKEIRDKYEIKLKAKDTYATALDRINKKIGLEKLGQEQEELISEMEAQKDTKDKSTYDLNMQLISSRLKEIEDEKKPLEQQRREAFTSIFEMQESKKPKEKMKYGGETEALAKQYNMSPEKVQELLGQYQQGGSVLDSVLADIGVKDEYTGEEAKRIMESMSSTYDLTNYFNVEELDGKGDNYRLTLKRKPLQKVEQTIQPQGIVDTTPSLEAEIPTNIPPPTPPQQTGEDNTARQTQDGRSILQMPEQSILPPSPLLPQLKGEVRLGRIEPVYVSPEAALTEQNRQLQTAHEQLNRLPDAQRQAVLASLLASSQQASNQTISQTQGTNQQAQLQADQFNIGQQGREDLLNLENAMSYEAKVQRGINNYEQSVNNYFNAMTQNQLGKYMEINRLNLLNQLYDNFQYTGDGIEQTSQPTFDFQPPMAKNEGKISKKIQDYLKK